MSQTPERLTTFLAAYEPARSTADAPRRADLDLRRLATVLPDLTIMERLAPEHVIFRLMGTATVARLGVDLTGHNFIDYLSPVERARIDEGLAIVAQHPCGTFSVFENTYSSGAKMRTETLSLPLDGGSGKPPYLIIALQLARALTRHEAAKQGTITDTRWLDGVFIDLGSGMPDQSVIDRLSQTS